MKTGRKIIIGAILSLSAAGAVAPAVASLAAPAAATVAVAQAPDSWYHA